MSNYKNQEQLTGVKFAPLYACIFMDILRDRIYKMPRIREQYIYMEKTSLHFTR